MVSKESHCLADLLHRHQDGEMNSEIVAVLSNHEDLRRMAEWYDIPFHCVPVTRDNKAEAFAETEALFSQYQADVIVLARYMQILPAELCAKYAGKVINIHHSFYPLLRALVPIIRLTVAV